MLLYAPLLILNIIKRVKLLSDLSLKICAKMMSIYVNVSYSYWHAPMVRRLQMLTCNYSDERCQQNKLHSNIDLQFILHDSVIHKLGEHVYHDNSVPPRI